ncbi:MAG: DMT family transporter [Pseudomonadota bacterium]
MLERLDPRWLIVAGAALFSTGGGAIKGTTLGGMQVACLRSGIAFVALMLLVPACRRGWRPALGLVGVSYAATLVLFVQATKLTTSANAIFLQSTAPLFLLFLAPWLLKEPVRRSDLGFMLAMSAGLMVLMAGAGEPANTAPDPTLGNTLGALAGVTWALTLLGLRAMARDDNGQSATTAAAIGNLFAFLGCAAFTFPLPAITTSDVLSVFYLGVVQIALAYILVTRAMARVTALEASLLILVEPVLNPVWTWWLHDEWPGIAALLAGALILAATVHRTLSQRPAPPG